MEVLQLLERYKRVYITEGGKQDKIKSDTHQHLVSKLRKYFDNTVINIMSDSYQEAHCLEKRKHVI